MNRRHFGQALLASLGAVLLPRHPAEAMPNVNSIYGKIRLVSIGEDYKVRVVSIGEDLAVQKVTIGADSPGKWEIVDIGEKFKIRIVDIGEDFKIRWV